MIAQLRYVIPSKSVCDRGSYWRLEKRFKAMRHGFLNEKSCRAGVACHPRKDCSEAIVSH